MIRDEVIERIGYPQKEYFIWYDDTEYCVRIREISPIMVIPAAVLNHKTVFKPMDWPRHYTWKDYYGIRNRMHMVRTHGNLWDYVVLRLLLWTGSGLHWFICIMRTGKKKYPSISGESAMERNF